MSTTALKKSCKKTKLFIRPITSRNNRSRKPVFYERTTNTTRIIYCFLSLVLVLTTLITSNSIAAENSCKDVVFIFARGSGQSLGDKDYQSFKSSLERELANNDATISYDFYELGTVQQNGAIYPAVNVDNKLLQTYVSAGTAYDFGKSVESGKKELSAYIDNLSTLCPSTKYVLGGYSQGGMVISSSIQNLAADKIIYAATFGDPKLYLPEGKISLEHPIPEACRNKSLSNYRIDVADCYVDEGILSGTNPYQTEAYRDKLGAWCNTADFMCGSYFDLSKGFNRITDAHIAYSSKDSYQNAAKIIVEKIATSLGENILGLTSEILPNTTADYDLVIVKDYFDFAYSVYYNTELYQITNNVINNGGRVSLYSFEQHPDKNQVLLKDFSSDLTEIRDADKRINGFASNMVRTNNRVYRSSLELANQVPWRNDAIKTLVYFTNSNITEAEDRLPALNALREKGIRVYIISGFNNSKAYENFIPKTGGQYFYPGKATYSQVINAIAYQTTIPEKTYSVGTDELVTLKFSEENGIEIISSGTKSATTTKQYSIKLAAATDTKWDLDFDGTYETFGEQVTASFAKSGTVKAVSPSGSVATINITAAPPIDSSTETTLTYITIDDLPLGFTDDPDLTINDLEPISVVKYHLINNSGRIIETKLGEPKTTAKEIVLKAPKAGVR